MGAVTNTIGSTITDPNLRSTSLAPTVALANATGATSGGLLGSMTKKLIGGTGGGLGGLTGTAGGQSGTGIDKPGVAPIQAPVNQDQVNGAQIATGNSLASQNALLAALQGQGGVTNQNALNTLGGNTLSNIAAAGGGNPAGVLNNAVAQQNNLNAYLTGTGGVGAVGSAIAGQGTLAGQLGQAGGIGAQTNAAQGLQNVLAAQQGTAGQLQGIANGTGPNPAQAALNQATGQNVANQAALMAGQRGAGANVGLLARQAGQQGAATQQQAAGQGATMQAQQQLNALSGLTAQQQAMAGTNAQLAGVGSNLTAQQQAALSQLYGQGAGAVGLQQAGINQSGQQGQAVLGAFQGQEQQQAQLAQNQIGNAAGVQNQATQNALANSGQLLGATGQYNQTQAGQQANVNTANAGLAQTQLQGQHGLIGGVLNSIGAALAHGGLVHKMADGGNVAEPMPSVQAPAINGPQSSFGQFLQNTGQGINDLGGQDSGGKALNKGMTSFGTGLISYFNRPSPTPEGTSAGPDASDLTTGNMAARGGMAEAGGRVAAKDSKQKAVRAGNSYANDKVPALLSEGEIVIPRSVMQSNDPVRGAADFVRKVMAKRGSK